MSTKSTHPEPQPKTKVQQRRANSSSTRNREHSKASLVELFHAINNRFLRFEDLMHQYSQQIILLLNRFIPGTNAFSLRRKRGIIRLTRERMIWFDNISSIKGAAKQKIRPLVNRHERIVIVATTFERWSGIIILAGLLFALFMMFQVAPQVAHLWYSVPNNTWSIDITEFDFAAGLGVIISTFTFGISFYLSRFLIHAASRITISYITPNIINAYLVYHFVSNAASIGYHQTMHAIVTGILAGIFYFNIGALSFFMQEVAVNVANYRMKTATPDSVLIDQLLRIGILLEGESEMWTKIENKQKLLRLVESAASCIQYHIPKKIKTGDIGTDLWFQDTMKQAANHLRSYKKSIITPTVSSRKQLSEAIASDIINTATGEWGSFHRSEMNTVSLPQKWSARIYNLLKTAVTGLLPLAIFGIVQRSPFAFSSPMSDFITMGSYMWALLTVIAALDPLFSNKIEALKNITDLLPGKNKGP